MFKKKCSKKQLTLGEVKTMAQKNDTAKKGKSTSVDATATVNTDESRTTSTNVDNIDEVKTIEGKVIDKILQLKSGVNNPRSEQSD